MNTTQIVNFRIRSLGNFQCGADGFKYLGPAEKTDLKDIGEKQADFLTQMLDEVHAVPIDVIYEVTDMIGVGAEALLDVKVVQPATPIEEDVQ